MVNEDFEDHDDHGQDVNIDNATQEQGDDISFHVDNGQDVDIDIV